MTEFEEKFHEVMTSLESQINAEPLPCLECGHPYKEHSKAVELYDENDSDETWYTKYGENCPTEDCNDFYCNPELWEEYAEKALCDYDERNELRERARKAGVAMSEPMMNDEVLTRDGKIKGSVRGKGRHCRMEGCTGWSYPVRWSDGKLSWCCTKGLVQTPTGWQIG